MGLISSGDEFCARTDRALADITGVFKLVDDILVHGETYEQLLEQIRTVFACCEEYGITLTKEKYQFGPVVKFVGYIVSNEGSKMGQGTRSSIEESKRNNNKPSRPNIATFQPKITHPPTN